MANITSMLETRQLATATRKEQEGFTQGENEVKHTAHASYLGEYHVAFTQKYWRKVIYRSVREDIIEIIKKLCVEMKVEIIEGWAPLNDIHLPVGISPYMSVAQFMGTYKRKSAPMIFDRHANHKYESGNFWSRGYCVDTVGKNAKWIQAYIRNQLKGRFG